MLTAQRKLRQVAVLACTAGAVLRHRRDRHLAEEEAVALLHTAENILRAVLADLTPAPSVEGITVIETPCGQS